MTLKQLRETRGLTQRELAELSGLNLRSLQDYEQGHKNIASAKGETLYRLSLALGCSIEELLNGYILAGNYTRDTERQKARLEKYRMAVNMSKSNIRENRIFSPRYKIYGRWEFIDDFCELIFVYDGNVVEIPFVAEFTEKSLPWLIEAAIMKMECYIENDLFDRRAKELGGEAWDEW